MKNNFSTFKNLPCISSKLIDSLRAAIQRDSESICTFFNLQNLRLHRETPVHRPYLNFSQGFTLYKFLEVSFV